MALACVIAENERRKKRRTNLLDTRTDWYNARV